MTTAVNQLRHALPNVLQSVPQPNILTGLGVTQAARHPRSGRPFMAAASVGIAVLALLTLLWRG
jgi:hypothetical protein